VKIVIRYFVNEWTNFDAIWHSGPRDKGMKWSTLGSGTQRSLSHTAEKRSEGMVEASLSNALGRVGFLVSLCLEWVDALFCCLWCNVEASCHKHFVVFSLNQHRRLLPVMCHNLRDDVRCLPATALTTPSLHSMPPLGGFPSEYCYTIWHGKTRMVFIRFERIHERDGHTDTHTYTAWPHRPCLCIASHGNNCTKNFLSVTVREPLNYADVSISNNAFVGFAWIRHISHVLSCVTVLKWSWIYYWKVKIHGHTVNVNNVTVYTCIARREVRTRAHSRVWVLCSCV